ncbi:hypothetical protein JCM3770_005144 [Rhodotorula araucariae]
MSSRDDVGRDYLTRLDAQTALHHLETAAHEAAQAGRRAADIARRELQHDLERFGEVVEDSPALISGLNGSQFGSTRWDGLKSVAQNALAEGARDVQAVRARLQHLPEVLGNPYPSSSTSNLEKGVRLHGQFAERYLGYAAKDAGEALRQAGMAGRYAFEVARRRLLDGGEPEKARCTAPVSCWPPWITNSPPLVMQPQIFKLGTPSDPLKALADQQDRKHSLAEGLMTAAGIAGDIGLGYTYEKWEENRRRRERGDVSGLPAA